jgi:hypothetical protein
MIRVTVNQREEMQRMEARILLEDLLEAWKHTRMFPASQGSLMIEEKLIFLSKHKSALVIFKFTNFKSNHRELYLLVLP